MTPKVGDVVLFDVDSMLGLKVGTTFPHQLLCGRVISARQVGQPICFIIKLLNSDKKIEIYDFEKSTKLKVLNQDTYKNIKSNLLDNLKALDEGMASLHHDTRFDYEQAK